MKTLEPTLAPVATVDPPVTIASPLSRGLGLTALAGSAVVAVLGLITTPEDIVQEEAVRLIYVHVPVVTVMSVACLVVTVASAMWLWRRSDGWDTLAAAAAEVGTLFTALGLVSGMIWGKPTWGAYWVWDARLTSTALLFLLFLGYLALRRYPAEPAARSKMSAIVGLLLVPNSMVVKYSVDWWRGLHQDATVNRLEPSIEGSMQFTLMLAILVGLVVFAWLLLHRFRVVWLESRVESHQLDGALLERQADADASAGIAVGRPGGSSRGGWGPGAPAPEGEGAP